VIIATGINQDVLSPELLVHLLSTFQCFGTCIMQNAILLHCINLGGKGKIIICKLGIAVEETKRNWPSENSENCRLRKRSLTIGNNGLVMPFCYNSLQLIK